ncbi:hypothetical protein PR002_g12433 [Phytophthora rubi]|uniref:CCHC-type domain-containing protein n=1 Tax=Phytophthora rubi TaxID=129364 RepID=A0A6A3LNJ7_9STRA|nr:hypothetical protein PR002_g12433 [Phytophthora rubi]
MWKTLEEMFEAPTNKTLFVHQQRQLVHQLRSTRAKRDDDMNLHLGKLYDIRDHLATMKYTVHDVDMVDAMLKSLPRHVKYQRLTEMVTLTPGSSYSVDDVRDLILVAASQLQEERYEFSGGRVENNGGRVGGGDAKTGKSGKQKHKSKQHQQQPDGFESKLKCFQCNQKGHIKKYCPELTGKKEASGADVSKSVSRCDDHSSAVSRQSQCEVHEVTGASGAGNHSDTKDESQKVVEVANYKPRRWVYDTGASTHIVGAKEYFVAYHEFEKPVEDIQGVAKGGQSPARGVGVAALATDVGDGALTTIFLEEALFVPNANWNLYSVGLAIKQGFVERKNGRTGECKVYRNGTLVLRSKPAPNNVWDFEAHNAWIEDPPRQVVEYGEMANFTNADGVANIRTWHARLGHTCAQHLKQMVDKELVRGMLLKGRELPTCGTCELTKQKRKKRNKRFERGFDEPNETIFMDLMDPGKKNSTIYTQALVIVDGYSRWMTVYVLTDKAAASGYFQQYWR